MAPGVSPRGCRAPGEQSVLAPLPEEPAGRIATRNAGSFWFTATLRWDPDDGIPSGPVLDAPAFGARFFYLLHTDDLASATRRVSCEIRALHAGQLTGALDALLRSVTTYAALTEAALETRVVRLAAPWVPPAGLVEKLARQLLSAGFPVSFGPSWTPVQDGNVSVGIQGSAQAFQTFLRTRPAWRVQPSLDKKDASG